MLGLKRRLAIAALGILSCGYVSAVEMSQEKTQPAAPTKLSLADSGKTITATVGQAIVIDLPVQRGTGYAWQVPKEGKEMVATKEIATKPEPPVPDAAPRPGATEVQEFVVASTQPGETELVFEYRRPWDHTSSPRQNF
jgi:predicted secreted protein